MKYFLDQEFIEGFTKQNLLSKRRHFIDLISIGIVGEDGSTFYAISNEYNYNDASEWVKENVIKPMYIKTVSGDARNRFTVKDFHKYYGRSNEQIRDELYYLFSCYRSSQLQWKAPDGIEMYGYFADYDWVLFCSLFGKMIDLPNGFPMYCKDLKQMLDEKALSMTSMELTKITCPDCTHDMYEYLESSTDGEYKIGVLKNHRSYPKQKDEHNALADAKWNKELYHFIKSL